MGAGAPARASAPGRWLLRGRDTTGGCPVDDRSFDRLARLLGEARDRRTGLKALVGGILGAGGLAALEPAAEAGKRGTDDRKGAGRTEGGETALVFSRDA